MCANHCRPIRSLALSLIVTRSTHSLPNSFVILIYLKHKNIYSVWARTRTSSTQLASQRARNLYCNIIHYIQSDSFSWCFIYPHIFSWNSLILCSTKAKSFASLSCSHSLLPKMFTMAGYRYQILTDEKMRLKRFKVILRLPKDKTKSKSSKDNNESSSGRSSKHTYTHTNYMFKCNGCWWYCCCCLTHWMN